MKYRPTRPIRNSTHPGCAGVSTSIDAPATVVFRSKTSLPPRRPTRNETQLSWPRLSVGRRTSRPESDQSAVGSSPSRPVTCRRAVTTKSPVTGL